MLGNLRGDRRITVGLNKGYDCAPCDPQALRGAEHSRRMWHHNG